MLDVLYEWIQNLVFFLLIAGMALDALPGTAYRKYVRFFTGMVVILLLASPIFKLSGITQNFEGLYHGEEYGRMMREVESMERYFQETGEEFWENQAESAGGGGESAGTGVESVGTGGSGVEVEDIEVEDVRIGE
ncbi:MAG: stage III sporulation protein AF [Ruminococcus sp.]|nr:stage III sporulation protein AF [Ruminococcus sp.]